MRTAILLLLAVAALAGCTESTPEDHCDDGHVDDDCPGAEEQTTTTAPAAAPTTHMVGVEDNKYSVTELTIRAGDTVMWNQTGSNPHTVTDADGAFDSHPDCNNFVDGQLGNCMEEGDTYSYAFDSAGEYTIYCKVHGSASGSGQTMVITVA